MDWFKLLKQYNMYLLILYFLCFHDFSNSHGDLGYVSITYDPFVSDAAVAYGRGCNSQVQK